MEIHIFKDVDQKNPLDTPEISCMILSRFSIHLQNKGNFERANAAGPY